MDEIEMYPVIAATVILPDLLPDAWSHYQECFQAWDQVLQEIAHPPTTPPQIEALDTDCSVQYVIPATITC